VRDPQYLFLLMQKWLVEGDKDHLTISIIF